MRAPNSARPTRIPKQRGVGSSGGEIVVLDRQDIERALDERSAGLAMNVVGQLHANKKFGRRDRGDGHIIVRGYQILPTD